MTRDRNPAANTMLKVHDVAVYRVNSQCSLKRNEQYKLTDVSPLNARKSKYPYDKQRIPTASEWMMQGVLMVSHSSQN